MLGKVKLDNTLLTFDQGNFNQITARSRNRTLVTEGSIVNSRPTHSLNVGAVDNFRN